MGEFFGSLYSFFFENMYGVNLSDYIWGVLSPAQTGNMYVLFGCIMLITTVVSAYVYYFVIDRFSLSHWWWWLFVMLIPAFINLFVGYKFLENDSNTGKMIDVNGNALSFASLDFLSFGLANLLMSIIIFILLTCIFKFLFKYTSIHSDCSQSPF